MIIASYKGDEAVRIGSFSGKYRVVDSSITLIPYGKSKQDNQSSNFTPSVSMN